MAGAQGTAVVDFGVANDTASVVITGLTGFLNTQSVEAWIFPKATTNNTEDDHWVTPFSITVPYSKMISGAGFTIVVKCHQGLAHGQFNVNWVYN